MIETYNIFRFRFKNKTSLPIDIYARNEETAFEIISWWNKDLPKEQQWYKPRFKFKHNEVIEIPPYEFEQMQLDSARNLYERRKRNEQADC